MSAGKEERVVFKQDYKSRNLKSTKVLNQKHLVYIATRPGVMPNPGSSFGLWGRLDGMEKIADIADLRTAYREVGDASRSCTVYRAILSVNEETAKEYGLYERGEWERILRTRMSVLRREMNIKPENFRWVASMHYKKTHPHVHIMYWDAGTEPKAEHIRHERFKELSENIRFAFTGAIVNSDGLGALHDRSDNVVREARLGLEAMLREAHVADALDLDRVGRAQLDSLGRQLLDLAARLPRKGSLKYDFLPKDYRAALDAYIESVIKEVGEFSRLYESYMSLNAEIGKLYGNSDALAESYRETARRAFFKAAGNETMKHLKTVAAELRERNIPESGEALFAVARTRARELLRADPAYAELLREMPVFRTPTGVILADDELRERIFKLGGSLAEDLRIRTWADGLLAERAKGLVQTKEYAHEAARELEKELRRVMCAVVTECAREDLSYDAQQRVDTAASGLLQLFRCLSQERDRQDAQHRLRLSRSAELSEAARHDLFQQRRQRGSWEPEL